MTRFYWRALKGERCRGEKNFKERHFFLKLLHYLSRKWGENIHVSVDVVTCEAFIMVVPSTKIKA